MEQENNKMNLPERDSPAYPLAGGPQMTIDESCQQLSQYLEDAAKARMELEDQRRQNERLTQELEDERRLCTQFRQELEKQKRQFDRARMELSRLSLDEEQ